MGPHDLLVGSPKRSTIDFFIPIQNDMQEQRGLGWRPNACTDKLLLLWLRILCQSGAKSNQKWRFAFIAILKWYVKSNRELGDVRMRARINDHCLRIIFVFFWQNCVWGTTWFASWVSNVIENEAYRLLHFQNDMEHNSWLRDVRMRARLNYSQAPLLRNPMTGSVDVRMRTRVD